MKLANSKDVTTRAASPRSSAKPLLLVPMGFPCTGETVSASIHRNARCKTESSMSWALQRNPEPRTHLSDPKHLFSVVSDIMQDYLSEMADAVSEEVRAAFLRRLQNLRAANSAIPAAKAGSDGRQRIVKLCKDSPSLSAIVD